MPDVAVTGRLRVLQRKEKAMRTIAFATQKGGPGKSTLAIGLAVAAMQLGERVSLLDTDRQGTVANWRGRRSLTEPAVEWVGDGYELERSMRRLANKGCTLAIIDTPGTNDMSLAAALRAADLCLIPARPSVADIEATHPTLYMIRKLGKDFAFVLNQAPARSRRPSEAAAALNKIGVLALPYIVERNDHQDALGAGLAASEFAPEGKAAEEVRALWAWVKRKLENGSVDSELAPLRAAG
jgi:chromosome partitioning protein